MTFSGTGIQFSSSADVVKGAIALLKQRNPRTKVLIAVGGATYTNWAGLNAAAIRRFVDEFGLDGVDIDYGERGCWRVCGGWGGRRACAGACEGRL